MNEPTIDNVRNLPANPPPTPRRSREQTSASSRPDNRTLDLVASCLALVRPASLTDAAAGEFLTIAAAEVAEFPVDILAAACRHVRRTATFPSQIVPMLVEDCERAVALRRFLERRDRPALPAPPEFDRPALPPMTQREVDKLPSYLVTIGLACGALVERKGKVRPAPAAKGARK